MVVTADRNRRWSSAPTIRCGAIIVGSGGKCEVAIEKGAGTTKGGQELTMSRAGRSRVTGGDALFSGHEFGNDIYIMSQPADVGQV